MSQLFLLAGSPTYDSSEKIVWKTSPVHIGHKLMNKRHKYINGNRQRELKIVNWNVGSRLCQNKLVELESLIIETEPDVCFISEDNLWNGLEDHEREIAGHRLILPFTTQTMDHARIALIVKNE